MEEVEAEEDSSTTERDDTEVRKGTLCRDFADLYFVKMTMVTTVEDFSGDDTRNLQRSSFESRLSQSPKLLIDEQTTIS